MINPPFKFHAVRVQIHLLNRHVFKLLSNTRLLRNELALSLIISNGVSANDNRTNE